MMSSLTKGLSKGISKCPVPVSSGTLTIRWRSSWVGPGTSKLSQVSAERRYSSLVPATLYSPGTLIFQLPLMTNWERPFWRAGRGMKVMGRKQRKVWCYSALISQIFLMTKYQQLALHISGSCWGEGSLSEPEICQLAIYGSCLSSVQREGFSMTWNGNKYLHLLCPSGQIKSLWVSLLKPQWVSFWGLFYFDPINMDENRCPWLFCCLENKHQVQRPDGRVDSWDSPVSGGRK